MRPTSRLALAVMLFSSLANVAVPAQATARLPLTHASTLHVEGAASLPFAPGEKLTFAGKVRSGVSGGGSLWVEGPVDLRGTSTWLLHSDMEGKVGPFRATDRNASWLDPIGMTALRYTSRERHILTRHDDAVDIFAAEHRWTNADGGAGETVAAAPLDELSFLYYLRTLPFAAETALTLSRHFDAARNPTVVTMLGREEIEVSAGRFRSIIVEMRVRDARRYRGEGTIRVHLSDDACRLILRLESKVPDAGVATLSLQSYEGTRGACSARMSS